MANAVARVVAAVRGVQIVGHLRSAAAAVARVLALRAPITPVASAAPGAVAAMRLVPVALGRANALLRRPAAVVTRGATTTNPASAVAAAVAVGTARRPDTAHLAARGAVPPRAAPVATRAARAVARAIAAVAVSDRAFVTLYPRGERRDGYAGLT